MGFTAVFAVIQRFVRKLTSHGLRFNPPRYNPINRINNHFFNEKCISPVTYQRSMRLKYPLRLAIYIPLYSSYSVSTVQKADLGPENSVHNSLIYRN